MPIQVTCPTCSGMFNAPDSAAGKKARCPKCGGIIKIPAPPVEEEIVDAEEEVASPYTDNDFDVEPPAELPAASDRKPCPMCGEMIQKDAIKCRFCGEIFDPALKTYQRAMRGHRPGDPTASLFLHIPISRLIVMSIFTGHLYEAYWIYKNWQFLKKRDGLSIWPIMRGIFGIFFCHSLLNRIYEDNEARSIQVPTFSPGGLATAWVLLIIVGNVVSRVPGAAALAASVFMPSFLCFVPVQNYINSVTERWNPLEPYFRWSIGHIVCIVLGILVWFGIFAELFLEPSKF